VASSGSIYGAVPDDKLPIREETPPAPFDMYSITKVAEEHVAGMLARRFRIPTAVIRIFNILGPGQDERHFCGHLAAQIVAIENGLKPPRLSVGPLTATRDFIDVRDVADGLIAGATHGEAGATYNLASGCEVSMQHVFEEMVNLSKCASRFQVDSKPGRPADMPRNAAAIDRIAACGFTPKLSLRQSLRDVLDYYRGCWKCPLLKIYSTA
jgi:GDP-4-dehydro-6-deoxy-D-mannose reductase